MKIAIVLDEEKDNVITIRELNDIPDRAAVAHFMAELDILKMDLLQIWDEMDTNKRVIDI